METDILPFLYIYINKEIIPGHRGQDCGGESNIKLSERTDLGILPRVLTNPAQQNLLTVGLLKARHHILHHILYLQANTKHSWSEKKNKNKMDRRACRAACARRTQK